jgi:hypothetical protein
MTLACIMAGEAGVMGATAQLAVAHVALNRHAGGLDLTLGAGFHGWGEPTTTTKRLAETALTEADFTSGCLYALSKQDRYKLGFPAGDIVFVRGPWELHLYKTWYTWGF